MYKLDELISKGTLQANLKDLFYQNARFSDPNMVRVMVHKGNEDYEVFSSSRCACMAPGEPPGGAAIGVRLC